MKKLLPQANDLDKVIDTFMYIYLHPNCNKQNLADYYGFTLRQVDYYTNACKYLDLINENWEPTELADDIFHNNSAEVTECVYQRIIEDKLIGQIFKKIKTEPEKSHSDFAKELVKEYFPGYSEAVYDRRSDNIIKWCKKILSYYN